MQKQSYTFRTKHENYNSMEILTLYFDYTITPKEIKMFRGAVLSLLQENSNILFHNHVDDSNYRYSYPLVQYKDIDNKAAIVLFNEATSMLHDIYKSFPTVIHIGNKEVAINLISIQPTKVSIVESNVKCNYSLSRWLPLNRDNYKKYCSLESLTERISMLEHIIIGNILSMAKGLGITIENEISVTISSISKPYKLYNKKIPLIAFDVEFACNIVLPEHIGIGKNASIGYGKIKRTN